GPLTPLTMTAARRLGNCGVRLVFAGPAISSDASLQPLLYQFRRDLLCFDIDLPDARAVSDVVDTVERACGRLDLVVHTLGGGQVDMFDSLSGSTSIARAVPSLRAVL